MGNRFFDRRSTTGEAIALLVAILQDDCLLTDNEPQGTLGMVPSDLRGQVANFPYVEYQISLGIYRKCRSEPSSPDDLVVPVRPSRQHRLAKGVVVAFDEDQHLRLQALQIFRRQSIEGTFAVD